MKYFGVEEGKARTKTEEEIYLTPMVSVAVPRELIQKDFKVDHQKLLIEPDRQFAYHYHKFAYDLFTVEKGEVTAIVNGNELRLKKGDSLLVEPYDKHAIRNSGNTDAVIIETRLNADESDRFTAILHESSK